MTALRTGLITHLLFIGLLGMPDVSIAQRRQRDVITREEIMASAHKDLDLYHVIRSVRPHFLQARPGVRSMGNSADPGIAVFVDRKRDIGLGALRSIRPAMVEEVRYLEPSKAESEFGFSASGGAVMVKLYKAAAAPKAADVPSPAPR